MAQQATQRQATLSVGGQQDQTSSRPLPTANGQADPKMNSKYYEVGLGRGVNVTDPHMWRNKSAFCVREPSLENTIKTKDCGSGDSSGMVESYRKEVSTHTVELQKIRFSLDSPNSHIKIDMDAQQTQSYYNEVVISGSKIRTETISFAMDFDDIPRLISLQRAIQYKKEQQEKKQTHPFEDNFCSWILDRILDRPLTVRVIEYIFNEEFAFSPAVQIMHIMFQLRQILVTQFVEYPEEYRKIREKINAITFVSEKSTTANLYKDLQAELDAITKDCKVFVENLGATHYVSSIDLGAMKYRSSKTTSEQKKLGMGASVGASKMAEGGVSSVTEKFKFSKSEEEQMIGKMNKEETEVVDKAVIGFQIQPIYELVQVRGLQPALQQAVKEYIIEKGDNSEGPFRIGCTIRKSEVFWVVDENNCLTGTASHSEASLFYIIPTGDPKHPSEFYIAYWGKKSDRKYLTNVSDPLVTMSRLPLYLSTDTDIFGYSKGPLMVKPQVLTEHARFCLHSRVLSTFACMCLSTPVSLRDWIDGEQFYINCTRRTFKIDGYITMYEDTCTCKLGEPATSTDYKTATRPSINDPNLKDDVSMLFRLYPPVREAPAQQVFPVFPRSEKNPMERQTSTPNPSKPSTLAQDDAPNVDTPKVKPIQRERETSTVAPATDTAETRGQQRMPEAITIPENENTAAETEGRQLVPEGLPDTDSEASESVNSTVTLTPKNIDKYTADTRREPPIPRDTSITEGGHMQQEGIVENATNTARKLLPLPGFNQAAALASASIFPLNQRPWFLGN